LEGAALRFFGPADGAKVTAPVDASGRVSGGDWRLEYRLGGEDGDGPWVTLASESGEVVSGKLGRIDPTMMLNGIYAIRLTSTTAQGQASVTNHISVEKNLKVGNFTVSFSDVSVPMLGLPIEVIRTPRRAGRVRWHPPRRGPRACAGGPTHSFARGCSGSLRKSHGRG